MIKIRLSRLGAKNYPFYRIVAVDQRLKRSGKPKQVLGHFNPQTKELKIDKTLFDGWVKKGAKITEAVKKLVESNK